MAIPPDMVLDNALMPTDVGAKLGHHVHDHQKEQEHEQKHARQPASAAQPVQQSRLSRALQGAKENAISGALALGLFGALFFAVKTLVGLGVGGIIAAAITGAVWYGAHGFIKAYRSEDEPTPVSIRAHSKDAQHDREPVIQFGVPEAGVVSLLGSVPASVLLMDDSVPVKSEKAVNDYLTRILESGPRRLDPADIAARAAQERRAAPEPLVS